jgi:hypothetical protein
VSAAPLLCIPLRDLQLVMPYKADVETTRPSMAGIRIEPANPGALLIATNGHIIGVMHSRDAVVDRARTLAIDPVFESWLNHEDIYGPNDSNVPIHGDVVVASENHRIVVNNAGAELFVSPGKPFIESAYPLWRNVVPAIDQLEAGIASAIAARYLTLRSPILQSANMQGMQWWHRRDTPEKRVHVARYITEPDLVVVVMPVRVDDPIPDWPEWMARTNATESPANPPS